MLLEIWSDIACPWCAVGERRLAAALDAFDRRDEVEVVWRSFELDPAAPSTVEGSYVDRLAAKYGTDATEARRMVDRMTKTAALEGWAFDFDRIRPGTTFDAHRLLHLAATHERQAATVLRFMRGYLEEGVAVGEPAELTRLAVDAGLDRAEVAEVLAGDRFAADVRADEQQAATFGIRGVPCFVLDRRYAVKGAQPAEALLGALRQAFDAPEHDGPAEPYAGPDHGSHDHAPGEACVDGRCAV